MGIASKEANLAAANREFDTSVSSIFGDRPDGQYQLFTDVQDVSGSTNVDQIVVDGMPALREWTGARQVQGARAYRNNVALRKWEKTIELPIEYVRGDKQGEVGRFLQRFVESERFMFDRICISSGLVANVTGYDGVSLMNNSHGNVGTGGTSDNLETAALNYGIFRTAQQKLTEMMDEAAEPLNIAPTLLLVGTASAEVAKQVTGSEKIMGIGDDGLLVASGGSGLDNGVGGLLPNYIGGGVAVAVSPRITGNEWFLMDTSKGAKPLVLYVFSAPEGVIKDDPKDDNMFFSRALLAGIHCDASPAGGAWQCIVGSVTA